MISLHIFSRHKNYLVMWKRDANQEDDISLIWYYQYLGFSEFNQDFFFFCEIGFSLSWDL